jgi:hypothetical protein
MGQLREKLSRIVVPGSVDNTRANQPIPEVQWVAEHVNQYNPRQQIWDLKNRIEIPPGRHPTTCALALPVRQGIVQKLFHTLS